MFIQNEEISVDSLIDYYNVSNDTELGRRIDVSKSTISVWRAKGIPVGRQAVFQLISATDLKANLSSYQAATYTGCEDDKDQISSDKGDDNEF